MFQTHHHHLPTLVPFYLGSAQYDFFYHSVLSPVTLSLTPLSFISLLTQSIHIFFGLPLPLPLHPSTFILMAFFVTCVSSRLFTWPYQDKRFPSNFSVTGATFKLPNIACYKLKIRN
ncbi:hypothetical protein PYW08_005881 [Mythimna loreyi]|uniref:Uncharacterized protein n=1 Tax=Mythimna loreyi TaxID=667449 RepID=A0ACC2QHS7_9NEOP|nr:hypothetical protein PYW08_005881 [Mythimna loreyi]